jgi:hypothetical protein
LLLHCCFAQGLALAAFLSPSLFYFLAVGPSCRDVSCRLVVVVCCLGLNFCYHMHVKDMAAKKGELPIVVGTKVCRYTDGVYTNGVLSAITTTKKGKQKVAHSLYCIMFEDKEKLNCGLDTVKAMQACFTSRVKVARAGSEAPNTQKALVPEGFNLYTHWTPELSVLAPACKPPPFARGNSTAGFVAQHCVSSTRL